MIDLYMILQLGQLEFQRTSLTPQAIDETKGEQGNNTGAHCLRSDDWVDMHHANMRIGRF